jgi:hypothetical protein
MLWADKVSPADQNAVLVTSDKDFGELVFRQRRIHAGVGLGWVAGYAEAAVHAVRLGIQGKER